MPMTPVVFLSDVAASDPGRNVATVAAQGYEKYTIPVTYWTELKNDPVTGNPKGYGPTLAAKWLVKEAALVAPRMVANGITKRLAKLDALPAVPAAPAEDPYAIERATLTTEIAELTALKTIVDADAVPRIAAFYNDLKALVGVTDPRWTDVYQKEWDAAKASVTAGPALPATI